MFHPWVNSSSQTHQQSFGGLKQYWAYWQYWQYWQYWCGEWEKTTINYHMGFLWLASREASIQTLRDTTAPLLPSDYGCSENDLIDVICWDRSHNSPFVSCRESHWLAQCDSVVHAVHDGWKEGNYLFNDALNTFYLQLYGVRHMLKDQTVKETKSVAITTWATLSD